MVNVTLEKPHTTLGENQFESSSLFLKIAFYSEKFLAKNQQANLQLISFPMLHSKLEITANRIAINVVQSPRFSCPLSTLNVAICPSFCVQKNQQTTPRFLYKPLLENCAKICISLYAKSAIQIFSTAALECVPSCCLLLLSAPKYLFLSCSPSLNLLMKELNRMRSFPPFPPLI